MLFPVFLCFRSFVQLRFTQAPLNPIGMVFSRFFLSFLVAYELRIKANQAPVLI